MSSTMAVGSPSSRSSRARDGPKMQETPKPPSLAPSASSQQAKNKRGENPPQDQLRDKIRVKARKNPNSSSWANCFCRQRSTKGLSRLKVNTAKAHSVMATMNTMGMARSIKCTAALSTREPQITQLPLLLSFAGSRLIRASAA